MHVVWPKTSYNIDRFETFKLDSYLPALAIAHELSAARAATKPRPPGEQYRDERRGKQHLEEPSQC
jgi:hypothetical protein